MFVFSYSFYSIIEDKYVTQTIYHYRCNIWDTRCRFANFGCQNCKKFKIIWKTTSDWILYWICSAAITWLKYSRYGVKLYPINQSILILSETFIPFECKPKCEITRYVYIYMTISFYLKRSHGIRSYSIVVRNSIFSYIIYKCSILEFSPQLSKAPVTFMGSNSFTSFVLVPNCSRCCTVANY